MPVVAQAANLQRTIRAAQYIRMSTDHQKYSLQNQMDAIAAYARPRCIDIVHTYADAAKSGLRLDGRPGLGRLLDDVQSAAADFDAILVYDVSRWGRFQDIDESAHYEFICKAAGVPVIYCAEPFQGEGIESSILKLLKRAMAAEYSRELSVKIFAGQCRLAREGFHVAGPAPYGLRRLLVDENGVPIAELAFGEWKGVASHHVILTTGPASEIAIIRRIYKMFVIERRPKFEIARILNSEGVPVGPSGTWHPTRIRNILTNENYTGNLVFGRRSKKLNLKTRLNPSDVWVRYPDRFQPIIDPESFDAAQHLMAQRKRRSDAEMLAILSELHKKRGRLSTTVISQARGVPSANAYRRRFGNLQNAYALIGHPPPLRHSGLRDDPNIRSARSLLRNHVIGEIEAAGATVARQRTDYYRINDQLNLRLTVIAATRTHRGTQQWSIRARTRRPYDVVLVARMDPSNRHVQDTYCLPNLGCEKATVCFSDNKFSRYRAFRTNSLKPLIRLCSLAQAGMTCPDTAQEFAAFLGGSSPT